MSAESVATAAVRRSNQTYYDQASRRVSLACGVAYFNPDYPRVPECNFLGEVLLDDETPDPVGLVRAFYDERQLTCSRWVPASQQDPEPVGRLLEPLGFRRREYLTYSFPRGQEIQKTDPELRVLGARAMRRAYARIIQSRSAEQGALADDLTAIQLERLDDPQYDGFVALLNDQPVGTISVYQVGEIGRVCDLFIAREHRRKGFATTLIGHAIRTAQRWGLGPVCMQVAAESSAARKLVEKTGFDESGTIVAYAAPRGEEVGA